jgi:hypothetical protein
VVKRRWTDFTRICWLIAHVANKQDTGWLVGWTTCYALRDGLLPEVRVHCPPSWLDVMREEQAVRWNSRVVASCFGHCTVLYTVVCWCAIVRSG